MAPPVRLAHIRMPMDDARYSRQTVLPEISSEGQTRLSEARVLCVGVGGLGSPAALYLAAAGVGTLGLIDPDHIDLTNLQRQILFSTSDQNLPKVQAGRKRLIDLNPQVIVNTYEHALRVDNAESIFKEYDLVIDGSDNFETRFIVNDAAYKRRIPWIYGAVDRFEGQTAIFCSDHSSCYRCLYPTLPKAEIRNCAEAGVLGSVVGTIGTLQATLAAQFLISGGDPHHPLFPTPGELTLLEFRGKWRISSLQITKNPDCDVCSVSPEKVDLLLSLNGKHDDDAITAQTLLSVLTASQQLLLVLDVREISEWSLGHIPNARHWPWSRVEKGILPLEAKITDTIVIYCASGIRSKRAVQLLIDRGFKSVRNLTGGLRSWTGSIQR